MSKYIGTWYSGRVTDNAKAAQFTVTGPAGTAWGTEISTGWSPTLQVRVAGDDSVVATLVGTWLEVEENHAIFMIGEYSQLYPTSPATYVDYEALLVLEKGDAQVPQSADGQGELFAFRIQTWP